nr:PREDICTED: uncharacterized protein LOC109039450 [Bemisia tabaci]
MKYGTITLFLFTLPPLVVTNTNTPIKDPYGIDDRLEIVHLYPDQWPTGVAVSESGRIFSCFPAANDELNSNNGTNNVFQVAELTGFDTETAYPNETYNNPPGGCVNFSGPFPRTKGLSDYLLSVPTVAFDQNDVLYLLDNGRCIYNGVRLEASPGGPKLVAVDLNTDSVIRTYTFPTDVVTPESFLGDVEFDRQGYAYITDFSATGDNAIIVLNLDDGDSWRVLMRDASVVALPNFVPFVWGQSLYQVQSSGSGKIVGFESISIGVEGLTISNDFSTLYYTGTALRFLYTVPTDLLRNRSTPAIEIVAAVRVVTMQGVTPVIGIDDSGYIYSGNAEQSAITVYDTTTGYKIPFVRDKRIGFIGRLDIVDNTKYLYFTSNQFQRLPILYQPPDPLGEDRRRRPFVLFRIPLLNSTTTGH